MTTEVSVKQRPSQFLLSRIESLAGTFTFFSRQTDRQVAFLLQIDFWDWEMDEMIFAVSNFSEREKAWRVSSRTAEDMLRAEGILLKNRVRDAYGPAEQFSAMRAPTAELARLITTWNDLLDACTELLDVKWTEQTLKAGGKALPNLSKYRKAIPS